MNIHLAVVVVVVVVVVCVTFFPILPLSFSGKARRVVVAIRHRLMVGLAATYPVSSRGKKKRK